VPNTNDEAQLQKLAQSILANCAIRHGGTESLAKALGVEQDTLIEWVGGKNHAPRYIVQKAVELLKADK